MAITTADLRPMAALAPLGGMSAIPTLVVRAGVAIQDGDVVTMQADGMADVDNTDPSVDIVGVASGDYVTNDEMVVALALPGVAFEAHMADVTGAQDLSTAVGGVPTLADITGRFEIGESATFAVINEGAAVSPAAFVYAFGRQIGVSQEAQPYTTPSESPGTRNPRVKFFFDVNLTMWG